MFGLGGVSVMSNRLDMDFGDDLIDNGTTDDHYTPPFIFEALGVEFDLDVSAPPHGVSWIPAKRSLSIIDDGLTTEWVGRVWCNPPYSNVTPWANKLLKHQNAIALLPVGKSLWFDKLWEFSDGILTLPSSLKFIKSDGSVAGIMTSTMLFAFGDDNRETLINSGLGRVR
jgi:hypothetical protein